MCHTMQQCKPLFLKEKIYKHLENQLPRSFFSIAVALQGADGEGFADKRWRCGVHECSLILLIRRWRLRTLHNPVPNIFEYATCTFDCLSKLNRPFAA